MNKTVKLNNFEFSNYDKLNLIAGPCVLESHSHAKKMVEALLEITTKLKINFVYKTSFDKANRTSLHSERGLGIDASLEIFKSLKDEYKINILTDVHNVSDCEKVKNYVDIVQIPAFLCRQTDLLIAAARTDLIVNIKKGQFLAPLDMINVSKKIEDTTAREEKELSKWLNKSEESLKSFYGQPDKVEFLKTRNRNYIYITEKFKIKCERKFEVNPRNIVVGFSSKNCF